MLKTNKLREIALDKLQEIAVKVRKCYKCGRKMHWNDFALGNLRATPENYFEYDMLLEIWGNPIFVIWCCWCYDRYSFPQHFEVSEL